MYTSKQLVALFYESVNSGIFNEVHQEPTDVHVIKKTMIPQKLKALIDSPNSTTHGFIDHYRPTSQLADLYNEMLPILKSLEPKLSNHIIDMRELNDNKVGLHIFGTKMQDYIHHSFLYSIYIDIATKKIEVNYNDKNNKFRCDRFNSINDFINTKLYSMLIPV